jgi:catechol 2,3-dioxygenase-like lactoylglutathione lyase family enzyme
LPIKLVEHFAITAKDFDKTIEFYMRNLGFVLKSSRVNKERGTKTAFLESGQSLIEVFGFVEDKVKQGPKLTDEETGIKHICFIVDEIDSMIQKLKDAGVEVRGTPQFCNFKDPDGVIIQLRPYTLSELKLPKYLIHEF